MIAPTELQTDRLTLRMVLCWLGVILFLQSRSVLQNAQDKADSPPGDILAARGEVKAVAFSPDGARLATAGGIYKGRRRWETGEIRIWDPKTKACPRSRYPPRQRRPSCPGPAWHR